MYFKPPTKPLYKNLIKSCLANDIEVQCFTEVFKYSGNKNKYAFDKLINYFNQYDMIIDAIFGFSFKPPIKQPFEIVFKAFKFIKPPIFSVDVPSGWDVENGNNANLYEPDYLISLSLPKLMANFFKGKHYLGGRFIPNSYLKENKWEVLFIVICF